MLLYLTSNGKSALVDAAAKEKELNVKKLTGKFSLKSIVTKDMRNYAAARFFAVDVSCCEESPEDFCIALQSFQMMFSARIIVILSGCENGDGYLPRLISCGVVNLVTADTPEAVTGELLECLSGEGMQRYIRQYEFAEEEAETAVPPAPEAAEEEIRRYRWNADNVKIAVAGAQRRCGTTMTAFNLASWLAGRARCGCVLRRNEHQPPSAPDSECLSGGKGALHHRRDGLLPDGRTRPGLSFYHL